MTIYIGIDPGASGAAVAIDAEGRAVSALRFGQHASTVPLALHDWISELGIDAVAALEQVASRPGQGVSSTFAFGRLYDPPRPHAAAPTPVAMEIPDEVPVPATTEAPPPVAPTVEADPVVWTVDRSSSLTFATSWGGEAIQGRFDRWTSDILFSPNALDRSKVSISIDMTSARSGDEQRDASLPGSDWFDASVHPKATFTATRFEKTGEGRFVARGNLTLRGVSRPLDLPFRLKIDGDRAEVSGVTSLDRTTFGVGQGEWTSTDQIPARVTVRIALKAQRK